MFGIDASAARSHRFGRKMAATASAAVLGSGGLFLFSTPAVGAEPETCTLAQASYQTALAEAGKAGALRRQVAAANQAVVEAVRTRDALGAAAVVEALQAQANLETAVAADAAAGIALESAQGDLQRALATARWAADAVDRIQTELDALPELSAAAEKPARAQLGAATAARSDAAVSVAAAERTLESATASQDEPAITAARAALVATQEVLETAEAQLAAAKLALDGVKAHGAAQLADARYRLEDAEQRWWEMDEHLMMADGWVRSANHRAKTAADAAAQAKDALRTAQNLEGIAAADAALAGAATAAKALQAQTAALPNPASIDRLFRSALEACAATSVTVPGTPVAPAAPDLAQAPAKDPGPAPAPAPMLTPQALSGVPVPGPGQTGGVAAANRGLNVQTGVVAVPAAQTPAGPKGHDGLAVAAWSLGGLLVLAAASFLRAGSASLRRART